MWPRAQLCSIPKAGLIWELAGFRLLGTPCLCFHHCKRNSSEVNPGLPHTQQNLSFFHESQFPHLSNKDHICRLLARLSCRYPALEGDQGLMHSSAVVAEGSSGHPQPLQRH